MAATTVSDTGRERAGGGAQRVVALVGPYLSGKTTLLENLLFATGAIARKGSTRDGTSIGDNSPEARKRSMGTEINSVTFEYAGDTWTILDCPGSIEFRQDALAALSVCDAAVVVCEPQPERAVALAPIFKALEDRQIPHILFVNKMDTAQIRVRDLLAELQTVSPRKLVLRQVPIRRAVTGGGEETTGYVDLVSERAYRYKSSAASDLIEMPAEVLPREAEARREMLEALAEYDDTLLEQLIEDVAPEKSLIYRDLHDEFGAALIAPVLLGAGEREHGVRRLLKALRHDTPFATATAKRRGLALNNGVVAECFKALHHGHAGKLSLSRVWAGTLSDGQTIGGHRVGGLFKPAGQKFEKIAQAQPGDVVAIAKIDELSAGLILSNSGIAPAADRPAPEPAVYAFAVKAKNRNDEVKLSAALHKLIDEDPSLSVEHRHETAEYVLLGQGEMHLKVALDKLAGRYNLPLDTAPPAVAYKETIRKGTQQHARYKRQTGGHGQFADIKVEIHALPRGSGFQFIDKVVGGSVPRNFIPAVEEGVIEAIKHGPMGHQVVDMSVTLYDGGFHAVDSSEMSFKTAARMAMQEGLPKCDPVLLEPILKVTIAAPNEATARMQRILSGRRGQILGFDAREGWAGWDEVTALVPEAEMDGLIIDIRSQTQGVGTYRAEFDHLQEVSGRSADKAIEQAKARAGTRG
ncbi:MAG: elongation factor G [Alphaproteobacteria bacterium]|nr:elongation factor G [Alphaproteobacteria bacterium]